MEEIKKNWWFILIIVVVFLLTWWYLKNRVASEPAVTTEPVKLEQQVEPEAVTEPSKKEAEAVFARGDTKKSALRSLKSTAIKATVLSNLDKSTSKYYVQLSATGMPLPEKGYYYEAWLVNDQGQYFSVGRVAITPEGRGSLTIKTDGEKASFSKMVVTLEPENGDEAPAETVLEGGLDSQVKK